MSYETNKLDNWLISTEIIDGPLIIVPDEDDDDDDDDDIADLTATSSEIALVNHAKEPIIVLNEISEQGEQIKAETSPIKPKTKSKIFHRSPKSSSQSDRTITIDRNFTQQQRRNKSKRSSISASTKHSITDSILSSISFDAVPNILAVTRSGSTYYCVEDLYMKIFTLLCTLDEFIDLLLKSEIFILKQVTLSEKISLTQQNSDLIKFDQTRYRLISIDSSDYLIKLKHLLLTHKNIQIEKIIGEMRSYKQTPAPILIQDKIPGKRLKVKQSQGEIFIQSTNSVNDNIHSNYKLTKHPLHRSKSFISNHTTISEHSIRSYSLPSIKLNIKEDSMLKFQRRPYDFIEDNYPMPMIVHVEENVPVNNRKIQNSSSVISNSHPHLRQSSSFSLSPIHTPYNLYHPKAKEIFSKNRVNRLRSPIMTSILENAVSHPIPTSKELILNNERIIYPNSTSSSNSKSPPSMHIRRHQARVSPYPSKTTYVAPLSNHYPYPPQPLIKTTNFHQSKSAPVLVQNSPNNLQLPHVCTRSISLSQAIIAHQRCNLDQIPKLVVRHSKTFSTKTIDTMGQLFPTWFNEPDYRCIYCFTCDQVFTPQLFMTHVDDELLINEEPLNMTSIQLLTSEKMSEYKVDLWNQFCTNLTIYAREGRLIGFTGNRF